MNALAALSSIVLLSAAGVAVPPASAPPVSPGTAKPEIPTALRGCWDLSEPPGEEHDGLSQTLTVSAERIVIESDGVGRREGTIELVERLDPTSIEGRISAVEDGNLVTLATTLALDPAKDELLLREGDAGSYMFTRCSEAKQAGQRLSLAIADTARQDDPRPAPCGPEGRCGDSLYRARFQGARVVAGASLPATFDARLKLHTPLIGRTTLALIVERKADDSLIVLRRAGFNGRTGVACFGEPDEQPVAWNPAVPQVIWQKGELCVSDPRQIDPNAPRE